MLYQMGLNAAVVAASAAAATQTTIELCNAAFIFRLPVTLIALHMLHNKTLLCTQILHTFSKVFVFY